MPGRRNSETIGAPDVSLSRRLGFGWVSLGTLYVGKAAAGLPHSKSVVYERTRLRAAVNKAGRMPALRRAALGSVRSSRGSIPEGTKAILTQTKAVVKNDIVHGVLRFESERAQRFRWGDWCQVVGLERAAERLHLLTRGFPKLRMSGFPHGGEACLHAA